MTDTRPASQTARTAAAARAAHLIVDRAPVIFADPLAYPLLADEAEELVAYHRTHGRHPVLAGARAQVVCRSRYAEERLAAGVGRRGVRQYVILGAGLDSFAYRGHPAGAVRVFEVDHPATQDWKRSRLSRAGMAVPDNLAYVPVDLAGDSLAGALVAAGFDPYRPAVVSWLGVTVYLTRDAVAATLRALGRLAPGTEIILDHLLPEELRDEAGRAYADQVAPVAAERGEPWLCFFSPPDLADLLAGCGFELVEHVRQRDMIPARLWRRDDALRPSELSWIARARLPGAGGPGRRAGGQEPGSAETTTDSGGGSVRW